MMKWILRSLPAAVLAAALTLSVSALPSYNDTNETADAETVSVTVTMVREDANDRNKKETVPWDPEALEGKTFSILGDSISTYRNISNRRGSRWANTTIGRGKAWYSDLKPIMADTDTWWMQMAEDLKLRLLVNNSWSGSTFFQTRAKTKGAFDSRCVQLHDNTGINDGAEPDIIFIYMGANDFSHFPKTLGTADIDYDSLFPDNESGTLTWSPPQTTLEAAAVVLYRIRERYPMAEVYVIDMVYRGDLTETSEKTFIQFNKDLESVAEHFGAVPIRFPDSPITKDTLSRYYVDARLHPSALGMDVITEAVKKAVLENTRWKTEPYHKVTLDLTGVYADYGTDRLVREGQSFTAVLTAEEGKPFTVRVTSEGQDITETVYADGVINIPAVTAEITVTAQAE